MAPENQVVSLDEPGVYHLDYETEYGWRIITRRQESPTIMKFKTARDAIRTGMMMGFPTKKLRVIDEIRGRKVKI